jgi:hypothetical protein
MTEIYKIRKTNGKKRLRMQRKNGVSDYYMFLGSIIHNSLNLSLIVSHFWMLFYVTSASLCLPSTSPPFASHQTTKTQLRPQKCLEGWNIIDTYLKVGQHPSNGSSKLDSHSNVEELILNVVLKESRWEETRFNSLSRLRVRRLCLHGSA